MTYIPTFVLINREYVPVETTLESTNTVEGYFSIVKRSLNGIYHSVSKKHLHRYLAEYEFRFNGRKLEDGDRVVAAIQAADGKRLRYREPVDSREPVMLELLPPVFD